MVKVTKNKIDKLCHRLYLTKDFQDKLPKFRRICGVPPQGFEEIEDCIKPGGHKEDLLWAISELLMIKHKLPPTAAYRIREYILLDNKKLRPDEIDSLNFPYDKTGVCDIEFSDKDAKRWNNNKVPIVKIIVSDFASQRDVLEFVRSQWKRIEILLKEQRLGENKFKNIRTIHSKKSQEKIVELGKYTLKELRELAPEGIYRYKADAITAIMKDAGFLTTSSNVNKVLERRRIR